ncbi:MAG: methyltransferase domain-containing protein [Actinobacteria bacterium]|nr:methyltransferase domain-containing protein [Actinomycetota bacterium]
MAEWNHSSDEKFYDYYANESQSDKTLTRFRSAQKAILNLCDEIAKPQDNLAVADIGCGPGTQALIWAKRGHTVHGLDVNRPLVTLAQERAREAGMGIDFRVGSATDLPWEDGSMDVCIALELIEHIEDWQKCLDEFTRILRPDGILCLSTTNKLCPVQDEFKLPLFGWYPDVLKKYYIKLAINSKPDLVNYAHYPAVNWFSFFSLRADLQKRGFKSFDRFDLMGLNDAGKIKEIISFSVRNVPFLQVLAHIFTQGTFLLAYRN